MPKGFPYRKSGGNVIWTLSDGEEIALSWEEFKVMVKTRDMIAIPRKEFEEHYKRMKLPKSAREYHKKYKNKTK